MWVQVIMCRSKSRWSAVNFSLLLYLFAVLPANSSPFIQIGTVNLWNVMFNWEERLHHIASIIKEKEIDIVAFQEVRFSADKATGLKTSQLEEVTKYLPNHRWRIVEPAGRAGEPENAYRKKWTEEGLGIISKHPIERFTKINLTVVGGKDPNPRLALHAQIRLSEAPQRVINVIAVHFSYEKKQQCQNTQHVLSFLTRNKFDNVIVLGDFNAYPDFPGPVDAFTSKAATSCVVTGSTVPAFKDVALANSKLDHEAPLTFSNMPSPGLVSRPDRILVSPSIEVTNSVLYGKGELYAKDFHTAIVLNRVKSVLTSAFDSFVGKAGYSCLHDCGPHGSCRCGICIKGGNKLNCEIPHCDECSSGNFILFLTISLPMVGVTILMCFYVLKTLVISANFNQDDLFDILGYRCCLFNTALFRLRSFPRRYKSYLGRAWVLCSFPPLPVILFSLTAIAILNSIFYAFLWNTLEMIYSILPEELFPSDHLMLTAEIQIQKP